MELDFEQQRLLSISRPKSICSPLVKYEYTKHSKIRRYHIHTQRSTSGTPMSEFFGGKRSQRIGSQCHRLFGGRFARVQNGREQSEQMQLSRRQLVGGISLESQPKKVRSQQRNIGRNRLGMVQSRWMYTPSSRNSKNPFTITCARQRGHY